METQVITKINIEPWKCTLNKAYFIHMQFFLQMTVTAVDKGNQGNNNKD